jgi:trimethylamine--corrinoid protein Co-methyltransferase
MAKPRISVLSEEDIQRIHEASLKVLRDVGVRVTNPQARLGLADAGVNISQGSDIVKFPESIVMQAIEQAGKQYILHGRDPKRVARYGYGDQNQISSPGEYAWFDHQTGERRDPLLKDTIDAAILGDALPNITIVGGMSVPRDVPDEVRDIVMTATLVKNTTKPTWCWASGR